MLPNTVFPGDQICHQQTLSIPFCLLSITVTFLHRLKPEGQLLICTGKLLLEDNHSFTQITKTCRNILEKHSAECTKDMLKQEAKFWKRMETEEKGTEQSDFLTFKALTWG